MGLPPVPKGKKKSIVPSPKDDPMRRALAQLEEYEEGTPKRTTKEHTCCPDHA